MALDNKTEEVKRCPRCGRKLEHLEFEGNHYLSCKCGYAFDLDFQRDVTSEVSGEEEKEDKKKKQDEIFVPFWRQGNQCFEAVRYNGLEKFLTFQSGDFVLLDNVFDFEENRLVYPSDPFPHPYYISEEDLDKVPDLKELYLRVLYFFNNYFAHIDGRVKKFLALYTIHSYILPLSPGVISVWLVGGLRAGKTTAQILFEWLGYRVFGGVGTSEAAIYRMLGHYIEFGPGLTMNEYDRSSDFLRQIFREADISGRRVWRVDKEADEKMKPHGYFIHASKITASNVIHGSDADLDRYIIINCVHLKPRKPRAEIEKKREVTEAVQRLRNAILLWKVKNFSNIAIPFEDPLNELDGRDWEHFGGILTIAAMISKELGDEMRAFVKEHLEQAQENSKTSIVGLLRTIITKNVEQKGNAFQISFGTIWSSLQKECDPVFERGNEVPTKLVTSDGRIVTKHAVGKIISEQLGGRKIQIWDGKTNLKGYEWDKASFEIVFLSQTNGMDVNVEENAVLTDLTDLTVFSEEHTSLKEDNNTQNEQNLKLNDKISEETEQERAEYTPIETSTSTYIPPETVRTVRTVRKDETKEGWEGNETHIRSVASVTSVTENNYAQQSVIKEDRSDSDKPPVPPQPEPKCPPYMTTDEWSKLSLDEKLRILKGEDKPT